jgi:methylmalonyl-CoA mutase N-terminal domain/subunit
MESKFNEMKDPVAGAYYIDKITREIVEKTWEMLVQKMNK